MELFVMASFCDGVNTLKGLPDSKLINIRFFCISNHITQKAGCF